MFLAGIVVAAVAATLATIQHLQPGFWRGETPAPAAPAPAATPAPAPVAALPLAPEPTPTPAPAAPLAPAASPSPGGDLVTVARAVRKAVVLVQNLDARGVVQGTGTGFFVSADGKFVTNAHVVENGKSFTIRREDGSTVKVSGMLAFEGEIDLAVLKADCTGVPFLDLEQSRPAEPGQRVVVIGSPLGLEGSVSDGIVSAVRTVNKDQLVQITAPLSPGSSGSPVLDLEGRLIGVATLASFGRAQSLNFAVGTKHVREIYERARASNGFVTQARPRPAPGKLDARLSAKDMIIRLKGGFSSGEVAAEVKAKGTSGSFPPEQLARIREAGGGEELIALCPKFDPNSPPTAGADASQAERNQAASGIDPREAKARADWAVYRAEVEKRLEPLQDKARQKASEHARKWNNPLPGAQYLMRFERELLVVRDLIAEVERTFSGAGLIPDRLGYRARKLEELRRREMALLTSVGQGV